MTVSYVPFGQQHCFMIVSNIEYMPERSTTVCVVIGLYVYFLSCLLYNIASLIFIYISKSAVLIFHNLQQCLTDETHWLNNSDVIVMVHALLTCFAFCFVISNDMAC